MFEDSTFESMGTIRTRSPRWMLATFAANSIVLLALILIPLIYPQALPRMFTSILMTAPAPPVEEPEPRPAPAVTTTHPEVQSASFQPPSVIPKSIPAGNEPEASSNLNLADLAPSGTGNPGSVFNSHTPITVVQAEPKKPVRVSSSVVEGLLVYKVTPSYPSIAKATGTQGTVMLQATISARGSIENLRVVSGPALLQQAALDAVQQWRYRPYLLNGQPIEVETTVQVVFKLN